MSSAQTTVMIYVGNMSRSGHQLPTEFRNWQESQLKQNFIKNTPSEYGRKTRWGRTDFSLTTKNTWQGHISC